jgi:hypothetical protein
VDAGIGVIKGERVGLGKLWRVFIARPDAKVLADTIVQ